MLITLNSQKYEYVHNMKMNYILAQSNNEKYSSNPTVFKDMSKSFRDTSDLDSSLAYQFLGVIVAVILTLILVKKIHFRHNYHKTTREYKLFEDLLTKLNLTRTEKNTLRQMAKEARLKQPAMCLVTPSLMQVSKELWIKEKGKKLVKSGKIQILNDVAHKLHDYSLV